MIEYTGYSLEGSGGTLPVWVKPRGGGGYENFVDIFLGHHQNWTIYKGVISMHFRVFS